MMSEPIEATKIFWESLVDGDFESINRFLSPDCRLQDSFDEHARGLAGNVKCLEKLKDVRQKIVSNRLNSTMKSTALMRNEKEVRFMISDKIGFISVTIGFALEWVHNIVTHIVIIKNVSESVFMVDNTKEMIPQPISVEPDNTAAVVHETSGDAQDQSSVERSPIEDLSEQTPAKSCDSPSGGKWYPGKYAKKVRSKSKEICHPSEQSNIGDMGMELTWESYFESVLGRTLTPPYLVPRPPPIPPTITVTVHRAVGLVSRMKRVVSRPINSYVEITVFDRVRSTPVVRMNANPVYDSTNGLNKFIFEIPNLPHFNATNGILHVDVKDTHMVAQEDILACVDIPFASIKTTSGQTAATELCYPLHLMEKNADILPRLHVSRKVRHPHTIATPVAVEGDGKAPVELRGSPCIFLSINKVDIMSWWVLEEQRMRDKKRKEAAAEEKMRAKLASPKKAALKSHQSKKNEEEKRRRRDPSVDQLREQRDHWVDDDEVTHCPSCKGEFGVFFRKHHCRLCGFVFCDDCSRHRIGISSRNGGSEEGNVRVCLECFKSSNESVEEELSKDNKPKHAERPAEVEPDFMSETEKAAVIASVNALFSAGSQEINISKEDVLSDNETDNGILSSECPPLPCDGDEGYESDDSEGEACTVS